MGNIYIDYDMGVPQIKCTDCGKCGSIMAKSLSGAAHRGCCHYFPEFTLVEIQRMATLEGGKNALDLILSHPGTAVYNFSIYCRGYFDKASYEHYEASGSLSDADRIRDHTIFFRNCPFVEPGIGCKLPPRFRTLVCNFFVCPEIFERPDLKNLFTDYVEERSRYSRWLHRENIALTHILTEKGLTLAGDFAASLELLAQIEPCRYEFPRLTPVSYAWDQESTPEYCR